MLWSNGKALYNDHKISTWTDPVVVQKARYYWDHNRHSRYNLYTVRRWLYAIYSTSLTICYIQYVADYMLYTVRRWLYAIYCTSLTICYIVYTVRRWLYTVRRWLYAIYSTSLTICCIQYVGDYMLYTVRRWLWYHRGTRFAFVRPHFIHVLFPPWHLVNIFKELLLPKK